jgi:VWFA-related protein
MRTLRHVGLIITALGVCATTSPPQSRAQTPTLSIRTDLVTLPVTVVDELGKFVSDLRQEDFVIHDDGEPRSVEFFTNGDAPVTIGLVIDSSGSMRTRRQEIALTMTAFTAMSRPFDEFFIVYFNDAAWLGLPASVPFSSNRRVLDAAISRLPAEGMSALYDGIDRALDQFALATRDRKALVVVSDGGDNASSQTLAGIRERARQAGAVLYTVALFDRDNHDAKPRVLRTLARESGGSAFTPRHSGDVMRAFTQIARDLRSGYTLGFAPHDTGEGGFRSIRVVADAGDGRRLVVRTRTGYYARP